MAEEIKNPNTEEEYQPDLMTLEDEDGNEVVEMQEIEETTLTICLHHTTPEQMAAAYGFTEQQNEHLALLRHEEYSVMWASLLGGFTHGGGMIGSDADWVGTGIFAWPLPQSFTRDLQTMSLCLFAKLILPDPSFLAHVFQFI